MREIGEIEELARASYTRRDRANAFQTQPSKYGVTVYPERGLVAFSNVRGTIAVYSYRDDGFRVVFRVVDRRALEDDVN